jgi:hypothetical protein
VPLLLLELPPSSPDQSPSWPSSLLDWSRFNFKEPQPSREWLGCLLFRLAGVPCLFHIPWYDALSTQCNLQFNLIIPLLTPVFTFMSVTTDGFLDWWLDCKHWYSTCLHFTCISVHSHAFIAVAW